MISMDLIKSRALITTALLVIIFLNFHTDANSAVTVKKISESALDNLIKTDDNKILITFMAAWCGPCIDELPVLNKLYNTYKKQGLKLIGISIDLEGPRAMQPIIDKLKVGFPIYWVGESAVEKFSLFAIPMLFLVKNGQIVAKLPGQRSEKALNKIIREFLRQ